MPRRPDPWSAEWDDDLASPDLFEPERRPRPLAAWKQRLRALAVSPDDSRSAWPAGRELTYVIDVPASRAERTLVLEIGCRQPKRDGEWRTFAFRLPEGGIEALLDALDREILALLAGAASHYGSFGGLYHPGFYPLSVASAPRYNVPATLASTLAPLLARTGRAMLRGDKQHDGASSPLAWDDGEPWRLGLEVSHRDGAWMVDGVLERAAARMALGEAVLVLPGALVVTAERLARFEDAGGAAWVASLTEHGPIRVPTGRAMDLLQALFDAPAGLPVRLPPDIRLTEVAVAPRIRLTVRRAPSDWSTKYLAATLAFDYDGLVVDGTRRGRAVVRPHERQVVMRDLEAEQAAVVQLHQVGARRPRGAHPPDPPFAISMRRFPRAVRELVAAGWQVEAEGKVYRRAGPFRIEVRSGIDWLDLDGSVDFDGTPAPLPDVLAALARGESIVPLGDGTFGMLPEEWLRRYALLGKLGAREGERVRFTRAQVAWLDTLLDADPVVAWDEAAMRARQALQRFEGARPMDPPAGFAGTLRDYQREGLGWLRGLEQLGLGGCLADDMGLGKTVQVLALLAARRAEGHGPSLVVVPRSLMFNWRQEAVRFTPSLRVIDFTGPDRAGALGRIGEHDVVLTTYGTLRRDADRLVAVEFDYVVLDEAQAIKNPATDTASAARRLRGRHRLALSGTPVENHVGELWSLLEFLNPGMCGQAAVFRANGSGARSLDDASREALRRALRPIVLRRTKAQVLRELPPRMEQTLWCELEPGQRALYEELRDYYRRAVAERIDRDGFARSKLLVLEALLRLRQVACHPGLVDPRRTDAPAGKLDVLLPRLREIVEEGHKALVFSQFTSLLALVRPRLAAERMRHEYLDGRTRDRAARVAAFQEDAGCPLFLVSLKAGGLGLNLTAADYVFLLDPWWNPAVEAQAIDRSHRIGQTRAVFAYRLIARGTIEEKVLALQESKRALADALITADEGALAALSREDVELLLG